MLGSINFVDAFWESPEDATGTNHGRAEFSSA